ncbi:helix-turn-helix transcriptional regulator [Ornithinimicrobium pratense]|uniref:HTH luxR-type domain-containing protein n=1 Tax=Ornithinimicrobium pratense TaxID=2593973 RepID=A0A5J6V8X7_9MICO|nr:helix-turn-helix domain-containing protein [Ornithinimicrobium pratense]QFG69452.1 hypothetical protein FY030_12725 [Ornithinimicrobium pratense]
MLEWLSLDKDHERVYRLLLASPRSTVDQVATSLALDVDEAQRRIDALVAAKLLDAAGVDGLLKVPAPLAAIGGLISTQQAELAQRQEELELARESMGALVDEFLTGYDTKVSQEIEFLPSADLVRARLYQLSRSVQREVQTVLPNVQIAREALEASLPLDLEILARGVTVRTVCSPKLLSEKGAHEHFARLAEAGGRVRVHPGPPSRMVLVDGQQGLIPVDPDDPARGAYLLKRPALTAPLVTLFQEIWCKAVPFESTQRSEAEIDDAGLGERVRMAVVLLAQGQKDAAVARRMNVSTRTVRRWLAQAMQTLGTDSRFELAVEATRRGWLPAAAVHVDGEF